jgi:hypothetical protein
MLSIENPSVSSEKVKPWSSSRLLWKVLQEVSTRAPIEVWLSTALADWWEASHAIEQDVADFEQQLNAWRDVDGNSAWHYVAAMPDTWGGRQFLNRYGIKWIVNQEGETPMTFWRSVNWAVVWVNLSDRSSWQNVWHKQKAENHPIVHWARSGKIDLACWGWANRPKGMTQEEVAVLRGAMDRISGKEHNKWQSWGGASKAEGFR